MNNIYSWLFPLILVALAAVSFGALLAAVRAQRIGWVLAILMIPGASIAWYIGDRSLAMDGVPRAPWPGWLRHVTTALVSLFVIACAALVAASLWRVFDVG